MPTYEYECTRCGHICEEFKPISAPRRQRCPKCRSKVERIISGGLGVHFKGSGFYITDSRVTKGSGDKPSLAADQAAAPDKSESKSTPSAGKDA